MPSLCLCMCYGNSCCLEVRGEDEAGVLSKAHVNMVETWYLLVSPAGSSRSFPIWHLYLNTSWKSLTSWAGCISLRGSACQVPHVVGAQLRCHSQRGDKAIICDGGMDSAEGDSGLWGNSAVWVMVRYQPWTREHFREEKDNVKGNGQLWILIVI